MAQTIPGARTQLIDAMINWLTCAIMKPSPVQQIGQTCSQLRKRRRSVRLQKSRPRIGIYHFQAGQAKTLSVYWSLLTKAHGLLVTIIRQQPALQAISAQLEGAVADNARKLLAEAILTLYFSSLRGQCAQCPSTNQIIYEAFQTFTIEALEWFPHAADEAAESLQIPTDKQDAMKRYLDENFGIELDLE